MLGGYQLEERSGVGSSPAAGFVVVVLGEHDVPAVEAVLAAVGDDLAFLPQTPSSGSAVSRKQRPPQSTHTI